MQALNPTSTFLASHGVAYAGVIARAATRYRLDPRLLAAVAAQETGGPGANAGANVVGDGGHGKGLFQIDDRYHAFARTPAAMNPAANADYAARMIRNNLDRFGGNLREALSAYNAGDPHAIGTKTRWGDGKTLGYADSVLRHFSQLTGNSGASQPPCSASDVRANDRENAASVAQLRDFAANVAMPMPSMPSTPSAPSPADPSTTTPLDKKDQSRDGLVDYRGILDPDSATSA